jgi:hypothetical protein
VAKTYTLDRAATGTGSSNKQKLKKKYPKETANFIIRFRVLMAANMKMTGKVSTRETSTTSHKTVIATFILPNV